MLTTKLVNTCTGFIITLIIKIEMKIFVLYYSEVIMKEKKTTEFEKSIKQSKELPKLRYKLDLAEHKLLLCFLGQIKQSQKAFVPTEIPIEDAIKYCGFNDANPYRTVKLASRALSKEIVEYNNGKEFSYIPWFKYIRYKNGVISYQLNDAIASELLQLYEHKKIYIQIDPRLIPAFHNNYALRLYLILKSDIASHKMSPSYSLEEIYYMMTLSSAYDPKTKFAVANQKSKIIQPAVEEINEVSDIHVEYEPVKFAKKITGWKFNITTPSSLLPSNAEDDKKLEIAHSFGLYAREIIEQIDKAPSWSDIIRIAKNNRVVAIPILQYSMETKRKHLSFYKRRYKEIMNKGYNNYYGDSQDLVEYDVNRIISMLTFGNYEILEDPVAEEDGLPF